MINLFPGRITITLPAVAGEFVASFAARVFVALGGSASRKARDFADVVGLDHDGHCTETCPRRLAATARGFGVEVG